MLSQTGSGFLVYAAPPSAPHPSLVTTRTETGLWSLVFSFLWSGALIRSWISCSTEPAWASIRQGRESSVGQSSRVELARARCSIYSITPSYCRGAEFCRPATCHWRGSRRFVRWLKPQYYSHIDKMKDRTCGKSSSAGGASGTKGKSCCAHSPSATANKSSGTKSFGDS